MRVSESLFVCSLGCKLRGAHLGRQQQRVFGKDCLDLLLLDLIIAVFGVVERDFAVVFFSFTLAPSLIRSATCSTMPF